MVYLYTSNFLKHKLIKFLKARRYSFLAGAVSTKFVENDSVTTTLNFRTDSDFHPTNASEVPQHQNFMVSISTLVFLFLSLPNYILSIGILLIVTKTIDNPEFTITYKP